MKFYSKLVVLGVFFSFIMACHKEPKCWGKKKINSGEIVADTAICNNCTMIAEEDKHFVVVNQTALNKLIFYNYGNNPSCQFNTFDFSKNSLLGVNLFASCNFKLQKEVTIDAVLKKYTYMIQLSECGKCSEQTYLQNWVLVPKIPQGYTVDFIIERY